MSPTVLGPTIQNWIARLEGRGLRGLLSRDNPPRKCSPLGDRKVQMETAARIKFGPAGHCSTSGRLAQEAPQHQAGKEIGLLLVAEDQIAE